MKVSVWVVLFLLITQSMYAKSYKDGGLYGSIGFAYLYNEYSDDRNTNSQGNFLQEYKLGYRGNLYSPRLVDYSLMGLIRYENIDAVTRGEDSTTKVESTDYKINFNFLKSTKFPFKIYAVKSDRPTSVVYLNNVNRYLSKRDAVGFSGAINLDIFHLNYSVDDATTKHESIFSTEDRKIKTYRTSIRKREKNYDVQLDYVNIQDKLDRKYSDGTTSHSDNIDDNINFKYRWDINEELLFSTYSYYRKKEFKVFDSLSSETVSTNSELRWNPKTKHAATIGVDAFATKDSYTTTKSINLRESYLYRLTKNLKISQRADIGQIETNLNTIQTTSVGTAISYTKPLDKVTRVNLSVSGDFRSNRNDSNASLDTLRYYYYTRVGLYRDFNSIRSKLNVNIGYSGSKSSTSEHDERYNADFSIGTYIRRNLRNNLRGSYYKESSKLRYLESFYTREVDKIELEDNINHNLRLGINGTLSTRVGVSYSHVENGTIMVEHLTPKLDMNLRYNIGPRIVFTSKWHLNQDVIYDIITYSANNRLAYRSRFTKVSLAYNYINILAGDKSEVSSRESHSIEARFERKF